MSGKVRIFAVEKQHDSPKMKIITQPIKHSDLDNMLPGFFGDMVKAVVDDAQRGKHDLGEFCRLYEVLADCYYGDNSYQTDPVKLQQGFDIFYNARYNHQYFKRTHYVNH